MFSIRGILYSHRPLSCQSVVTTQREERLREKRLGRCWDSWGWGGGVSQIRRQQKTGASFLSNSLCVTGSSVLVLNIDISCNIIIIKIYLLSNQRDIRFHAIISVVLTKFPRHLWLPKFSSTHSSLLQYILIVNQHFA